MEQTQFWLSPGTLVGGRYTLEQVLGKGGYGITYRGTDTRLQQSVAIKEYYPVFWCSRFSNKGNTVHVQQGMESHYCKGLDRFLEEARTLAQLSGISGVVRVTDFFEENGTAYLVMEYLEGKNLKQILDANGGRIPPQVLLPALSPVLFALKKVHEKGLIHRDLSPDNIMMLSDGSVRLIDFGNARDTGDNRSMTMAMKEGFAAPEQYRSKGQGPYTDVYGICATVYYCLTGKLPTQAMERLMGASLPRPSELGVALPSWQEDALLGGLELYVQKRIQNVEELWQRLYVAPENQEPAQPQEPVPEPLPELLVEEAPSVEAPEPEPEITQIPQEEEWIWPQPVHSEPADTNPLDGTTVELAGEESEAAEKAEAWPVQEQAHTEAVYPEPAAEFPEAEPAAEETVMPQPEYLQPVYPEPADANPLDGMTVELVREEEPVLPPVWEMPPRERYFVPPKAPEPQPVREPTLAERMQRMFRRR